MEDIQVPDGERAVPALKRLRWGLLATGLAGAAFLVAFQLDFVPGLRDIQGGIGTAGVFAGAGFLAAAGFGSWSLFTRLANTRTRRVSLSSRGIQVEFSGRTTAEISWDAPRLVLTIKEYSDRSVISGATLLWGSGRMGEYAFITRTGAEQIQAEAAKRGLQSTTRRTEASPNQWLETEIRRS